MSVLFINACVREESRTIVLAREVLKQIGGEIDELVLEDEGLAPLDRESLALRQDLLWSGKLNHPMLRYAHQFAQADEIVIAAPYWDLSFPSALKVYLEHVCVVGVTFDYTNGRPGGLCRAKKLTYVTTAGGEIIDDFGYTYVKALCNRFFSITDTVAHRAMWLDAREIDAEDLLEEAEISVIR